MTAWARPALAIPLLVVLAGPLAAQTDRCPEPAARQFDFWIGEWDVRNRQRSPQAAPGDTILFDTGSATDRVRPVLGGCAIVEHWYGELTHTTQRGYSVRAWDPALARWVLWLLWPGPAGVGFSRLDGTFVEGRGEFTREVSGARGPATVRFTFSDIEPDALVWTGAFAPPDGAWTPFWVMDFERRVEGAPSLGDYNGMDEGFDACPDEAARAFDFLVGEWRSADGDATLEARTILDGCGVVEEESWAESGETERGYRVRARETSTGAWGMIAIDDRDRSFTRWEARPEAPLELVLDGGRERVLYEDLAADRFTRVTERTTDGGARWAAVERREFRRVGS